MLLVIAPHALIGRDGLLTPEGTFLSFFPTILASSLPMVLFATRWYRSAPGLERSRSLWLLLPFLFWSIHDGTFYFPLAFLVPDLFNSMAVAWPMALAAIDLARLAIVAIIATLAARRLQKGDPGAEDKILVLVVAYSVPLSLIQLWGLHLHGIVDGLIVLLLFYGIARYQVLDIDFGIRFAFEKSSVLASFAIVFIVASEIVERALGIEGALFGVLAALAVGLLFRRMEQTAHRFADRLFPDTRDSARVRRRRHDIYRNAFLSAFKDGHISDQDRDRLADLADRLGLSAGAARALERNAVPSAGIGTDGPAGA